MTWPMLPNDLLAALESLASSWPGTLSVACEHLHTGERWCFNDVAMPAASLIKVPLAIAAYQAHEAGVLNLGERVQVPVLPSDTEAEFDNLGFAPAGIAASWRKVVDRMITESDNAATNVLIDRLGFGALERLCGTLGLNQTRLQRKMLDSEARASGQENWTTASEMVILLRALVRKELVTPLHTLELLGLLAQQRSDDKLAAGFSPNRHFAHKTGELPGYRHDVGVVDGEGGWVVAALVGGPDSYTEQADALLREVAQVLEAYWQQQGSREQTALNFLKSQHDLLIPDSRLAYDHLRLAWQHGAWHVTGLTSVPQRLVMPHRWVQCDAVLLQPIQAVVRVPCLQLRSIAGHHGELVSQLRLGERVDVLHGDDEWVLLRGKDGYVAWGKRDNLTFDVQWAPTHHVKVPVFMVRDDRGTMWQLGALSQLLRVGANTYALPDGQIVQLSPDVVAPLSEPGTVHGALAFAESMLGLPYLWGGASGWGIDCSGLVQLAFASQGLWLPRDADQQEAHTLHVKDRDDIQTGDLLYFPGHVAIFVGNGRYIHASAKSGCVTFNSLFATDPAFEPKLAQTLHGIGRTTLGLETPQQQRSAR